MQVCYESKMVNKPIFTNSFKPDFFSSTGDGMSECPHFRIFQFRLGISLLFVEKKENYTSKLRHVTNMQI